jgi:hypothetical protein
MRILGYAKRKIRMASNEGKANRLVVRNIEARKRAIQRKEYVKIEEKRYKGEVRKRLMNEQRKRNVRKYFPKRKGGRSLTEVI